jgi:Ribonuclease G/E
VPTVIYNLLGEARRIGKKQDPERGVVLRCNPDVAKELKSRSNSYLQELEEFFGASVIVKSDVTLARENFDID